MPRQMGPFMNVEAFAGRSEIAKAFKRQGYNGVALDIELDPLDVTRQLYHDLPALLASPARPVTKDILSPIGFLRHLMAAASLARGGLYTAAVVCSSWVCINSTLAAWCASEITRHTCTQLQPCIKLVGLSKCTHLGDGRVLHWDMSISTASAHSNM